MSDGATCDVFSDFSIRLEIGLERGADHEYKAALSPGRNHRTFELRRGVNHGVPRDIIAPWLKTNRRYLDCIKQGRIRVVEQGGAGAGGVSA
jgi:hypothetical protein